MNLHRCQAFLVLLFGAAFSITDAFAVIDRKATVTKRTERNAASDGKTSSSRTSHTSPLFVSQQISEGNAEPEKSIRDRILEISNIASLLCVVDCTVLPMVTVLLPLVGLGASASTARWLHELGHSVAMFFVLPVGGLATVMNFLNHKNKALLSLAGVGLSFVYAANGHGGPILSMLPHSLAHDLHCGTKLHRITNILGCACLLSSNYIGRKIGGCAHHDDCADGHDHCHDHKHD